MVKGGFYKLLYKSADKTDLEQPVKVINPVPGKCPRLGRWKFLLAASTVVCFVLVCGFNYLHPITSNGGQDTTNTLSVLTATRLEGVDDEEALSGKIRYKHTRRKLPTVLIIGARKAGTRALLTYLNLHPQIITAKQEVHFFDDNYDRGLEWYRKQMPYAFPEQVTLEKTPAYFVDPYAPERVHAMNSSILLLLIVRDPVERTISDYNQIMLKKQDRNKPIASFEELALDSNGDVNQSYNAIQRSVYARYMKKWLRYFPLSQIHIVNGEGLVDDPLPHIHEVETFLRLKHRITKDNFYFNETRGFYCIRNETMEKCLNPSKGRSHPPVRPDVMNKLRVYFRPYNERFYEMVHKNYGWQ